jgi:hypothetical protein
LSYFGIDDCDFDHFVSLSAVPHVLEFLGAVLELAVLKDLERTAQNLTRIEVVPLELAFLKKKYKIFFNT